MNASVQGWRAYARARDRAVELDHARDLVHELDHAHTRALALVKDPDLDLVLDLVLELDHARELADTRDRSLARDLARTYDLCLEVARELGLARGLEVDPPARVIEVDHARVSHACVLLVDLADEVGHARARARAGESERSGARQVASSADGLLTVAARLLPAADRARYGEEYDCELRELAQSGAGFVRQARYALRQLRRAPQMGLTLRAPRHKSAIP